MSRPADVIVEDNGASIRFDFQYHPILISWWTGQTTVKLAELNFEARNPQTAKAAKEGRKAIVITDLSKMKMPPAAVRKQIAEMAKVADLDPGFYG